jgi:hypothetical protein
MKSERRHELKHNELSDWLGEHLASYQPHATAILLGGLLLFAAIIGGIWYFGGEDSVGAKRWSRYFSAVNQREPMKVLEKLAAEKSGSNADLWALQALGDMQLSQGAALLHSDRVEAQKLLQQAEASYKQVEKAPDAMLRSRALLGLAKTYESLGKIEDARKYYDLAAEASTSTAIKKAATADAQRLKNSRQVAFLDWFSKQTPKRPAPLPGMGGGLPGLPGSLPDRPDITPPSGLGLDNLGAGLPEGTPAFPAPASPPADGAAPGTPAPAGTQPDSAAATATPEGPKTEGAKAEDAKTGAAKTDGEPAPSEGTAKASAGKSSEAKPD